MGWYGEWRPYVPVAKRRARAARFAQNLAKKEKRPLAPVSIIGRKIATTFWGQAWMENLERYSDFDNRLPRGRTYVRNGSVIDLVIERGRVKAIVSGSDIYRVQVSIGTLSRIAWKQIKDDCANSIDSLIDLLSGKFDQGIMQRLTQPRDGLFPQPNEIQMQCSCPDWATLCKHAAAVMYGIGARLDTQPELLFTLRGVDHTDLIRQATAGTNLDRLLAPSGDAPLGNSDLGELFGIDLETRLASPSDPVRAKRAAGRRAAPKPRTSKAKKRGPQTSAGRKLPVEHASVASTSTESAAKPHAVKRTPHKAKAAPRTSSTAKKTKPVAPRSKAAPRAAKPSRKR